MGAAQFRDEEALFLYRVGGVAVDRGRVLLHRSEFDDFWSIPGGRVGVGETSADALAREMREETGAEVRVGRLLWVVENFFRSTPLDGPPTVSQRIDHHELGVYLQLQFPVQLTATDAFFGTELTGTPNEFTLEFRWFPQSKVDQIDLRPRPLRQALSGPLPSGATRLVNRS
ncbi:MAG: NUDIX domain-containing protein [Acidimicrobiia bacterium]